MQVVEPWLRFKTRFSQQKDYSLRPRVKKWSPLPPPLARTLIVTVLSLIEDLLNTTELESFGAAVDSGVQDADGNR